MAVEIAVPIAFAAYLLLTGEPSCPTITWTDEAGIEWTEEVCMSGSMSGWEAPPVEFAEGSLAAVPEPSVWGVMLLGFGLAGWGLRRSRAALKLAVQSFPQQVGQSALRSLGTKRGVDAGARTFRVAPKDRLQVLRLRPRHGAGYPRYLSDGQIVQTPISWIDGTAISWFSQPRYRR